MSQRCTETLEGPARPSGVVLWRRLCKRRTSHPSRKCWQHRSFMDDLRANDATAEQPTEAG